MSMQNVYDAANSLEAHMVQNLLEQVNISSWVDGDFLSGGVGELPATGLIKVQVNDDDVPLARRIVEEFERQQPALEERLVPPKPPSRWPTFAAGLLLGAAMAGMVLGGFWGG